MRRMTPDRRYLNPEELTRIITHTRAVRPLVDRVLLSLLLLGRRIGEIVSLKRSDVDLDRWVISYLPEKQKHPERRTKPIPAALRQDIMLGARRKTYPPDWPLVGLDRVCCFRHIKQIGLGAGVPWIFPHAFRHTFAVIWIDSGGSITELQEWLDHEDPKTTTAYLRWSTKRLEGSFDRLGLGMLLAQQGGAAPAVPVGLPTGFAPGEVPGAPSPPVPVGSVAGGEQNGSMGTAGSV